MGVTVSRFLAACNCDSQQWFDTLSGQSFLLKKVQFSRQHNNSLCQYADI